MNVLEDALRVADRLLQRLVPPRPRRLCYRSHPDFTDNAYWLFRHAVLTRERLEHVWLLGDMSVAPRLRAEFAALTAEGGRPGHVLQVHDRRTLRGYWAQLRSRCVFHTHGIYRIVDRAHRREVVNLWHGMPIKCIGRLNHITPNPYPTFGTRQIATSSFFRYVIAAAFATSPDAVEICAQPRCDALRPDRRAQASARIRAHLKVPADRRLLLWMPTYRTELKAGPASVRSFLDDLFPEALAAVNAACERHGVTVIVKLHPFDLLNDRAAPAGAPHLLWLRATDWNRSGLQLYDLIAASDGLMSDVSSVLIDYLVTDRPAGIVGFDRDTYTRDLVFPADYLLGSRRFRTLKDAAAVEDFVAQVGREERVPTPAGDVANVLVEPALASGSEHLLRAIGIGASA